MFPLLILLKLLFFQASNCCWFLCFLLKYYIYFSYWADPGWSGDCSLHSQEWTGEKLIKSNMKIINLIILANTPRSTGDASVAWGLLLSTAWFTGSQMVKGKNITKRWKSTGRVWGRAQGDWGRGKGHWRECSPAPTLLFEYVIWKNLWGLNMKHQVKLLWTE